MVPHNETLTRDEAATNAVHARQFLIDNLTNGGYSLPYMANILNSASKRLRGHGLDQAEIDTAPARIIAERYSRHHGRGTKSLGRAALIAPLSETRLAHHRDTTLSRSERTVKRHLAIRQVTFAALLVATPDWYIKKGTVRRRAAKIVRLVTPPPHEQD